ncbi:MAG TPA: hypothetical protein VN369_06010 [Terriglobales bacterium]|nr:hypothetical protein [Terriglobales bacterium]
MLPKIPAGRAKTKRQLTGFLGLNLREGASGEAGELADCLNLSSGAFPALSQRGGRAQLAGYTAPSALYGWNGLVAVDGTELKIDGEAVATVAPGEKQFAVVNTKLCIFPDKVYLDLTNHELKPLEASISSLSGTTATFTTSSLTVNTPENLGTITAYITDFYYNYNYPNRYEYDYIRQYTSVSWDNDTKTWTLLGGGKVRAYSEAEVGKYIMLKKTDIPKSYVVNVQSEEYWSASPVEITVPFADNNDRGIYAKIIGIAKTEEREGHDEYTKYRYQIALTLEIHDASFVSETLTNIFSAGNLVSIAGADIPANNVVKKALLGVTDTTLTFSDGTFTADTQSRQLTISRTFPDLDYVCESQNRLWGVSKADNTIYASALGDPTNFYLFEGTSLDSYTSAVGSEGVFTGICKYDRSVLCFKENTLHRVYGDFPAEYSTTERPMFGVKEGAAGTLVNIGSVLYYLGRDGVYAFAGNTPSLVSGAFGEKRFSRGRAGAVDTFYCLSAKEAGGGWGLYVLDTRKGLWLREDDTFALSFATVDGRLHFVKGHEARVDTDTAGIAPETGEAFAWTEDGAQADFTFTGATGPQLFDNMAVVSVIGADADGTPRAFDAAFTGTNAEGQGLWTLTYHGAGDGAVHAVQGVVMAYTLSTEEGGDAVIQAQAAGSAEAVLWMAEFAPFTEGTLARKSPSRLALRCELGEGAWMMAELSCDNEPFRQVFTSAGKAAPTLTVPIMPRRCDSYRVRLSGEGACVIRCAERVFRIGSEER